MLVAPEAALTMGASYLFLLTLREGAVVLVKFTADTTFNALKKLLTSQPSEIVPLHVFSVPSVVLRLNSRSTGNASTNRRLGHGRGRRHKQADGRVRPP
jgi:hypothetical protein